MRVSTILYIKIVSLNKPHTLTHTHTRTRVSTNNICRACVNIVYGIPLISAYRFYAVDSQAQFQKAMWI